MQTNLESGKTISIVIAQEQIAFLFCFKSILLDPAVVLGLNRQGLWFCDTQEHFEQSFTGCDSGCGSGRLNMFGRHLLTDAGGKLTVNAGGRCQMMSCDNQHPNSLHPASVR